MEHAKEYATEAASLVVEWWPYIILVLCVLFITCVCVLKFTTYFWYHQPLTFRWTMSRFFGGGGGGHNTRIMNPLRTSGTRCYNAVVYSFLHFVNHDDVRVYSGDNDDKETDAIAPYERIAAFLSRCDTEIVAPGRRLCIDGDKGFSYIPGDILRYILSQESHGLSVFIGVLGLGRNTTTTTTTTTTAIASIKGVCVLTPRIMLSFTGGGAGAGAARSVSIYVCDHLAWLRYTTRDRDSLELLETTEYIQKSREIAGEQTLYRYREIPWFVVPFTTVYSYTFTGAVTGAVTGAGAAGTTVVPVSSVNFALFYAFVNQHARDFRYCILYELSQLQSLVQGGIYRVFMLVLNQVRVLAVYIFAPSWRKASPDAMRRFHSDTDSVSRRVTKRKRTRGNRITELHDYIAETSTALVKYLPPVEKPKYDIFGKRVKTRGGAADTTDTREEHKNDHAGDIALLLSSIRDKSLCDCDTFMRGFYMSLTTLHPALVCIDTIAHNYLLIDAMLATSGATLVSREKWYYIMYNAIIERETLCKDIFTA